MFAATNELRHVADVKVSKVRGKSKTYPQLRLPSRYAYLAGARASVYTSGASVESVTFVIHVADHATLSPSDEESELQKPAPCGGHDAGSNLALGPLFFSPRVVIAVIVQKT